MRGHVSQLALILFSIPL